MDEYVNIYIDQKEIKTKKGANLLEVALKNGFDIPNLCYNSRFSITASCRLCIVKIHGIAGFTASCAHTVEHEMHVTAFDDELEDMRKTLVDMLFSQHNDDCISCSRDSDCILQDLAFRYNLSREERTLEPVWQSLENASDSTSHVLNYDSSKCVMCEKCIKACKQIQGKGYLNIINRGLDSYVGTGHENWIDSKCDGCGECAQACPVGALTAKSVYSERKNIRKKDVDKTIQTTCPYCGVGCQINVSILKNRIVNVEGADKTPNYGSTCVKGRFGLDFANHPERLKKPLLRKEGKLIEVSWDEALTYTAKKLKDIKEKSGKNAIAGLASARCTNEENYIFQKFFRSVIGTNNNDHCARLCHSSTVAGLATTLGSGAMTNSIEELEHADVIIVTGSNTTETHPVIANCIKRAVLYGDTKLIVIDPRKIDLVRYSTIWLRQHNGTDVAWLNGLMNIIIRKDIHDKNFIRERTEGFTELWNVVSKYTPNTVEKITGIPSAQLIEAAELYGNAKKGSIVYAMGITQHTHGTNNVKSVANLAMITGNIGRESTGVNPLRGQNNVQGACDMGALPNVFPGYQKVIEQSIHSKFEKAWSTKLSDRPGLTIVEMMNAACSGELKAMYIMGENPVISDANSNHVTHALKSLDFLICQDIFLTETAQLADVVFPVSSFAEKDGTFTNTERRVLPINKILEPVEELRTDWQILKSLAEKMGVFWQYSSWKDIIAEINSLTPQYAGITAARIANGETLQWPCPSSTHPGTKFLHKDKFTRGKGLLTAIEHVPPKELPNEEYPFVMSTGRILYHYHTGSMTRRSKSLNNYVKDAYFEMNSEDMVRLSIKNGEKVKLSSRRGTITIAANESEKVKKGNIFVPFHFAEAAANKLTTDALDPVSKIPEYKICAAKIEKI
jgi:formate dehydrogenase alpha subunit